MRAWVLLFSLWGTWVQTPAATGQSWGVRPNGVPLHEIAPTGTPAVVLFFVSSDCPISNRMFPEMQRLRESFKGRGVRTWFVYPNLTEKPADILAHQQAFDAKGEALQDPGGALVRLSHAVVTPEMAVLAPAAHGWRPVYTGRIDNRYEHIGVERSVPNARYGEDAIIAVLRGKAPRAPVGAPVGCAIVGGTEAR